MTGVNAIIGARVRYKRVALDMSMGEVVAELRNPITIQQFANYERGISRWPVDLLSDVARILSMDIKALCEEEK